MIIGYARAQDFDWLGQHDPHVSPDWIRRCLLQCEYILASNGPDRVGLLRFSLFWGNISYMDFIWVAPNHRRQQLGTDLFSFWRQDMSAKGAKLLMTSSMSDEPEPQAWHQRNGFRPSGSLTFGQQQPTADSRNLLRPRFAPRQLTKPVPFRAFPLPQGEGQGEGVSTAPSLGP